MRKVYSSCKEIILPAEPVSMKPRIRLAQSASECGGSDRIPRIQKDFPRFFRREMQSPFREEGVRANLFEKIFLVLKIFFGSDNSGLFAV